MMIPVEGCASFSIRRISLTLIETAATKTKLATSSSKPSATSSTTPWATSSTATTKLNKTLLSIQTDSLRLRPFSTVPTTVPKDRCYQCYSCYPKYRCHSCYLYLHVKKPRFVNPWLDLFKIPSQQSCSDADMFWLKHIWSFSLDLILLLPLLSLGIVKMVDEPLESVKNWWSSNIFDGCCMICKPLCNRTDFKSALSMWFKFYEKKKSHEFASSSSSAINASDLVKVKLMNTPYHWHALTHV